MYYINQLGDLATLIGERISQHSAISQATDAWIAEAYGIENFTAVTEQYFGTTDEQNTRLVLCRQIPSVRVEDIACTLGSQILGHSLLSLPFIDDTFSSENHEKKSYLHVPWASHGRKGDLYFTAERIVDGDIMRYVGKPLSSIPTKGHIAGTYLHEYHFAMRTKVFGDAGAVADVSELHRMYVRLAKKKPSFLYVQDADGVMRRTRTENVDFSTETFRPPSEWYYALFYAWFLSGKMVILETYDNPLAQVSQAKILFEETMRAVRARTGYLPLVLKVPPLDQRMLALPRKIVENPTLLVDVVHDCQEIATDSSVTFFIEIAERILARS